MHLDKLVYITDDGRVIINPRLQHSSSFGEVQDLFTSFFKKKTEEFNLKVSNPEEKTPFQIECEATPQPIKDHMPFWYLTHLKNLKAKVDAGEV